MILSTSFLHGKTGVFAYPCSPGLPWKLLAKERRIQQQQDFNCCWAGVGGRSQHLESVQLQGGEGGLPSTLGHEQVVLSLAPAIAQKWTAKEISQHRLQESAESHHKTLRYIKHGVEETQDREKQKEALFDNAMNWAEP